MPEPPPAAVVFSCQADDLPRLDRFLGACLPEWSRTRLQALIRAGAVRIQGSPVDRPSAPVPAHAQVAVSLGAPPAESAFQPEPIPLDLLYEDDDLVVVNKPAGLIVHPGAGQRTGTLVNALLYRYGPQPPPSPAGVPLGSAECGLSTLGGATRPGIVHRLDRFTSGVMAVARNDLAHQRLAAQFQARSVRKTYMALVQGAMAAPQGEVNLPIRRDLNHRVRMTTRLRADRLSRDARTAYLLRESFLPPSDTPARLRSACSFSWLEVRIFTGRTHQIRVHMAALGHPVVGDRLYGAAAALAGPGPLAGLRPERVMLHASSLELDHPRTGARMSWTAPLPGPIEALLLQLRACGVSRAGQL